LVLEIETLGSQFHSDLACDTVKHYILTVS